jgi:hypothetical protein
MQAASSFNSALAILVLFLHALFILWVVFGALLTRSRPDSSLAAHRFPRLGNPYGSASLVVSFNALGKLA